MDIRKFLLSFYKNASEDFHIFTNENPIEALQWHSHDYFQIFFVAKGRICHHVNETSAELSAGDVTILPPSVPHYIEVKSRPVSFFSLSFLPEFLQKGRGQSPLVRDFLAMLSASPDGIPPKLSLPHGDVLFAEEVFCRIQKDFQEKKLGFEELILSNLTTLLTLFARVYMEENAEDLTLEWKKETAIYCMEYVKSHFAEPISLEEIARRFAMSKTSFCSTFRAASGSPFKEFLNSYRIQKATEMLAAGEKVSLVATQCGFSDFSTFYRNFKKKMGLSPSEYQKKELKK